MDKETGGPAFPGMEVTEYGSGPRVDYFTGMTLRDYFAASSPIGLNDALTAAGFETRTIGTLDASQRAVVLAVLATMRGEYADTMIAERAK